MRNWNTTTLNFVNINYATRKEGVALISEEDEYVKGLGQFDLDIRLHREGATVEDYIKKCKLSVLDFSDDEIDLLREIFCEIHHELERRGMIIPYIETINVVKTTVKEEGGMLAYTRGNTIYLGKSVFNLSEGDIERIVCHELFHILSRCSNDFKKDIYKAINFKVEDKNYELKKYTNCRFISNPDVSSQCSYIEMDGPDHKTTPYYMVTIAPFYSESLELSKCLMAYFIPLDSSSLELKTDANGCPILIPFKTMQGQFLELVGDNTSYTIDPQEVLAENFRLAVLGSTYDLPSPHIVDAVRNIMRA